MADRQGECLYRRVEEEKEKEEEEDEEEAEDEKKEEEELKEGIIGRRSNASSQ